MDFLFSIEYIPIRERDRGQRGYGAKYPTDSPLGAHAALQIVAAARPTRLGNQNLLRPAAWLMS